MSYTIFISCYCVGYLGIDRAEQLLRSTGEKIEKEFDLQSRGLLEYAVDIQRSSLPDPAPLMLEQGKQDS